MSSPEEAKEIIRRWNDEGWSGGKYDLAHEIISPNMTVHGAGGQTVGMGPDGLIDLIKTWRTAFPDGSMSIDELIVEGDTVGIRNTWRGTHEAEFYGIPPSGKHVTVTSIGIDRVVDGLVVEGWGELDMVGMMQQMGALPTVGGGLVANGKDPSWGPTKSGASSASGSPEENKKILIRFIEALSQPDRDALADVVDAERFVDHNPVWGTDSLESLIASHEMRRRALPDLHMQVDRDNMVSEGDQVVGHFLVTGTHTGDDLFGVPASGTQVTWTHSDMVRIDGGRVVERWVAADTLTLFQQAGILPSMGGGGEGGE